MRFSLKALGAVAFFIVSRGLSLVASERVWWDVHYYWTGVDSPADISQVLVEYPVPVAWALEVLRTFTGTEQSFRLGFAFCLLLVDAITAILLWRRHPRAGTFWLIFGAGMGAISYYRLDLIPAALVALALLWIVSRPVLAGSLLGVAAAVKLWPALLILPFSADLRGLGRLRILGFGLAGGGLGVASLIHAGWTRSSSPLTWQGDRGLQIESVAATVPMIGHALDAERWPLHFSKFNAWEVTGPGTDAALDLTTALTGALIVVALALMWRMISGASSEAVAVTTLALVGWLIVTNKTFSPQYLWWIAGPVALWCGLTQTRRAAVWVAGGSVCLAVATQLIFPWWYDPIVNGSLAAALLLGARNLGVIVLATWALVRAWRTTDDFGVAS